MIQQSRTKGESEMLAKLMIKYGLATKEQVLSALAAVRSEEAKGADAPLGNVLIQMGIVTEKQLDTLRRIRSFLMVRQQDRRVAEDLLNEGLSTSDQVEAAFQEQERLFRKSQRICRLSEILSRQGTVASVRFDANQPAVSEKINEFAPSDRQDSKSQGIESRIVPADKQSDDPQTSPMPDKEMTLVPGEEGELRVSDDGLKAVLVLRGPHPNAVTVERVRTLLEAYGITHGIIEENRLVEFLNRPAEGERTLEVAQGAAPVEGKEGSIEYFFETDPLKIGAVKDGERIDYKDRGQVPQVNEGDLLARLTPTREGRDGCNIYGQKTKVYKPKKMRLYCGEGVILSEDALEARAKRAGQPKISVDGRMVVEPEYVVRGDVNLETGHIDFAGNICVYGTIEDGFRVKGGSLSAKEIMKAEIEIAGDIVVTGGIIGANVKTQGNVKAKFIQGAAIEAMGDVLVESSVIDSKIQSCGTCFVRTGKIYSSTVQAKRGIEARQIGSEQSKACQLVVGLDERLENQFAALRADIKESGRRLDRTENALHKLTDFNERTEMKMGRLIQRQDGILREIRSLEEEAQELETVNNPAHMEQVKFAIQEFQSTYRNVETKMADIQNKKSEPVKAKIRSVREKIAQITDHLNDLREKFESLSAWAKENPPLPMVKVYGTILPGTQVRAAHSSVRIKNELEKVIIQESRDTSEDSVAEWRMAARPLRQ